MAKKKKAGRKSLYDSHIAPYLDEIEKLVAAGYTEISIAKRFGVGETAFINYKKQHKELAEAIRRGRADVETLVNGALIKKAIGFYDDDGKYHEPDYKSIIMIKRNYRTGEWTEIDPEEKSFRERELKLKENIAKEKIIDYEEGDDDVR